MSPSFGGEMEYTQSNNNLYLQPILSLRFIQLETPSTNNHASVREYHSFLQSCTRLWSASFQESWVQGDITDMMSVHDPGQETLKAKTKSTMRTGTILPLRKKQRIEI